MITTIEQFKAAAAKVAAKYSVEKFYVELLQWNNDDSPKWSVVFYASQNCHAMRLDSPEVALGVAEKELKELEEAGLEEAKALIEKANKLLIKNGKEPINLSLNQ